MFSILGRKLMFPFGLAVLSLISGCEEGAGSQHSYHCDTVPGASEAVKTGLASE